MGPSLTGLGISGALADPTLELRDGSGALLFQNDNWQDDPAQAAQLTALGLAPQNPNESGIVATLSPGAYTAIVAGKNRLLASAWWKCTTPIQPRLHNWPTSARAALSKRATTS